MLAFGQTDLPLDLWYVSAIVLSGIIALLLPSILLFRRSRLANQHLQQRVITIWKPLLEKSALTVPHTLPQLTRRDHVVFLYLWNEHYESVRDAMTAALVHVAQRVGTPHLAKELLHSHQLSQRILAVVTLGRLATVVERLAQAGAVMLGKANMDEFAMGSSNETSRYGPVRNPWVLSKVPGGSSGGSAAAVAARMAPAATGTDTGGSIRQPAALTSLTGLKPTYGRVSRYGMIAFASSLDQAGTLTLTARDAALLLGQMAGFDPRDSTSVDTPVPDYLGTIEQPLAGLKIGLLKEFFDAGLDSAQPRARSLLGRDHRRGHRLGVPDVAADPGGAGRRGALPGARRRAPDGAQPQQLGEDGPGLSRRRARAG